jgi:hypothetical protein
MWPALTNLLNMAVTDSDASFIALSHFQVP